MDKTIKIATIAFIISIVSILTSLIITIYRYRTRKLIKPEYTIELQQDFVLIQNSEGKIYKCTYDNIEETLLKDNQ